MNTRIFMMSALLTLLAPAVHAEEVPQGEAPMVVYAQKPHKTRIRMSEIDSWTADSDTRMVLTTKWRRQYLVEFEHRCSRISKGGSNNYALVTDGAWLDRNGHIRVLDRNLTPNVLSDARGLPLVMGINAASNLCAVKEITDLGKKPRAARGADS
jgi:hypothetical protein